VSLSAEVARDYLILRGLQERLRIARDNLALQEDTLALTRSLQGNGFISDLNVSRANTEVCQTRAQIVPLTTLISQQEHALATLLGQEPNSLVAELDKSAAIPDLPATVAIGLPSDLLRRRPDLRAAERQIAAANARIGVAVADYYPKFSLTGDFGLDSARFSPLFDIDSRFFIIYPTMQWKLFDAGHTKAEVQEQKELYRQAVLAYQSGVLNALRDVEDALVAYNNEQDHRAQLTQAVESARDSVDISRDLYKQGLTDFLQVLDAQRQLLSAQDELAQSNQAIATNLVALYKALGGGWEQDAIRDMEAHGDRRESPEPGEAPAPTTQPSTRPAASTRN
jgi:NodT family efflux transporter outer membrane factor (OMF) lipoprotein